MNSATNRNIPENTITYSRLTIIVLAFIAGLFLYADHARAEHETNSTGQYNTQPSSKLKDRFQQIEEITPPSGLNKKSNRKETKKKSDSLGEIISSVKKGILPKAEQNTFSVRNDDSEINMHTVTDNFAETQISPDLKQILQKMNNGTFSLPVEEVNPLSWSDPFIITYKDTIPENIYSLAGSDQDKNIFLTIEYGRLSDKKDAENMRNKRIDDLKTIISIIDYSGNGTADSKIELDRKKAQLRAYTQQQRKHSKTILNYLGIEKVQDDSNTYEEQSKTFRRYKQWMDRMKKLDDYLQRKRKDSILDSPKTPKELDYRQPNLKNLSRDNLN